MNDTTNLLSLLRLKFNIEHPSLEESYAYGYEAAKSGIGEEENPFCAHTRENEHWTDGWWAGYYGEEPLFAIDDLAKEQASVAEIQAANDHAFSDGMGSLFVKVLEITSVIGVVALVGYQVLELVA